MERLEVKWKTAAKLVPPAEIESGRSHIGVLYYGTTALPIPEALDLLGEEGIALDTCRVRGFPFGDEVRSFIDEHDLIFVVEQNRDAQMRTLLINEDDHAPAKLVPITYYAGLSISADFIQRSISDYFTEHKISRLTEVQS